ncbi:MAG TPA: hypothetical protein VM260_02575, partial [Pirellula sp.]|nr:hypothetical protein [Pirellula sp.]
VERISIARTNFLKRSYRIICVSLFDVLVSNVAQVLSQSLDSTSSAHASQARTCGEGLCQKMRVL